MQFILENLFVDQFGAVFSNQGRRHIPGECIFNNFIIFTFAQDHTDTGILMFFFYISVQRLEIKIHFSQIFRFEVIYFKLEYHKAPQISMKKKKINEIIIVTNRDSIIFAYKDEIST